MLHLSHRIHVYLHKSIFPSIPNTGRRESINNVSFFFIFVELVNKIDIILRIVFDEMKKYIFVNYAWFRV